MLASDAYDTWSADTTSAHNLLGHQVNCEISVSSIIKYQSILHHYYYCMYVRMYACTYVPTYVCTYSIECTYGRMYART